MFDPLPNDLQDLLTLGPGKGQAWLAHPFAPQAHLLDGQLDVLHELDVRIDLQQRIEPAVQYPGLLPAARTGQLPEILILAGESDARTCDPAIDAEHRRFEQEIIDADEEGIAVSHFDTELGEAPRVRRAFLDGDEIGKVG